MASVAFTNKMYCSWELVIWLFFLQVETEVASQYCLWAWVFMEKFPRLLTRNLLWGGTKISYFFRFRNLIFLIYLLILPWIIRLGCSLFYELQLLFAFHPMCTQNKSSSDKSRVKFVVLYISCLCSSTFPVNFLFFRIKK